MRQRFGEAHQRVYFFGGEAAKPIEFVSFRLGVVAPLEELPLLAEAKAAANARASDPHLRRQGLARRPPVAPRRARPGEAHIGPGLIEDPTSTLYVPAGWTARFDANDNTILERQ